MAKVAHSHGPSMTQIGFDAAVRDGNESEAAGFYWVKHNGEVRVAEFRRNSGHGWEWDFTRAEIAKKIDTIIEFLDPPEPYR